MDKLSSLILEHRYFNGNCFKLWCQTSGGPHRLGKKGYNIGLTHALLWLLSIFIHSFIHSLPYTFFHLECNVIIWIFMSRISDYSASSVIWTPSFIGDLGSEFVQIIETIIKFRTHNTVTVMLSALHINKFQTKTTGLHLAWLLTNLHFPHTYVGHFLRTIQLCATIDNHPLS